MIRILQIIMVAVRRLAVLPFRLLPFKWRVAEIEKMGKEMQITTPTKRGSIRFFCPTPLLLMRAEGVLSKEPDMIAWIDSFPHESVFWDVGANIGVFSLYAGLKCDTTVLAFEPGGGNYDILCRNIQINGFPNVKAYCLAFSRDSRLGVLNMASAAVGTALNQFGNAGDMSRYAEISEQNVVQGMIGFGIDDFIAHFDPPFPSYLKIDVDGLEWPILLGAEKTLRDPRLRGLMAELTISDPIEYTQTLEFLKNYGFTTVSRGEVQTSAGEKGCNHIFIRTVVTKE